MKTNEIISKDETILIPKSSKWVYRTFSERFMTELALLLIPTTLLPLFFSFSTVTLTIFEVINVLIILIFAAEYIFKLFLTKPSWKYAINPWHILDLLIILFAVIDFFPILPIKGWRGSPLLRLLRLFRVIALTGRSIKRVKPSKEVQIEEEKQSILTINILTEKELYHNASVSDAEKAINDPIEDWIDIQGISRRDLALLSNIFSIPEPFLESKLFHDNFPTIDFFSKYTIVTLWDAKWKDIPNRAEIHQIENPGIVIICTHDYIATLSVNGNSLFNQLSERKYALAEESFSFQILYSILKQKNLDYAYIFQVLEQRVAELEEISGQTTPPRFLEVTFMLKKLIQKQGYNIRHFSQLVGQASKKNVNIRVVREESLQQLDLLHDETESLSSLCQDIRENLISLIELQLNKVSFDLNRVLKILAVITCLALVPTIIGGLLGQNLKDQPFNIGINEIFFLVISMMLIGLYIFYRKGWLK